MFKRFTGLFLCCLAAMSASFPAPDLTTSKELSIWATDYHIHEVAEDSGPIRLLSPDGQELGPRLSARDFCLAAADGALRINEVTYTLSGTGSAERQADCLKIVKKDVGGSRFVPAGGSGYQLVPYRTIATDPTKIATGTVLFIPAAVGVHLPDGSTHDGYFLAADVRNLKGDHIYVFEGNESVKFPFVYAKPQPPIPAYVVNDPKIRASLLAQHQRRGAQPRTEIEAFDPRIDPALASIVAPPPPPDPTYRQPAPQPPPPAPNPGTPSSSTIPEFGKPRGDYVPCLFTVADQFRFKNAIHISAVKNVLLRQRFIGRVTASDAEIDSLLATMNDASDVASIASALAQKGYIQPKKGETDDDAVKAVANALMGAGKEAADSFDVSCSQSILTYKETSDIFGKRVAGTYVPIQVVVRNLNANREFLMHDVQVAVDSQTGNDNRFNAGRDKLLVRGVATRGQSDDPRNRFIRIAEAVGDIASASTIGMKALDLRNGISVFRSAFLPGVKNIFPDYTIDQLNRLNDLAFSANTSYKLVVAKNGAAPFVTFVPIEMFASKSGKVYSKWDADDVRDINKRVWVVFAGVHIVEADSAQITATDITCANDATGAGSGTLNCTLKGQNLQTVEKVRLRNAHDSTDPGEVDANLDSSGSVKFDASQLAALRGTEYSVILVDKSGHEISTGLTLKFTPTIDSVDEIKTGDCKDACTVAVKGSHLDGIQSVIISKGTITVEGPLTYSPQTQGWTATFKTKDLAGNAGSYDISIKASSGDAAIKTGKSVNVS